VKEGEKSGFLFPKKVEEGKREKKGGKVLKTGKIKNCGRALNSCNHLGELSCR